MNREVRIIEPLYGLRLSREAAGSSAIPAQDRERGHTAADVWESYSLHWSRTQPQ